MMLMFIRTYQDSLCSVVINSSDRNSNLLYCGFILSDDNCLAFQIFLALDNIIDMISVLETELCEFFNFSSQLLLLQL